jgi:hypothetical protein
VKCTSFNSKPHLFKKHPTDHVSGAEGSSSNPRMSLCLENGVRQPVFIAENSLESDDPDLSRMDESEIGLNTPHNEAGGDSESFIEE